MLCDAWYDTIGSFDLSLTTDVACDQSSIVKTMQFGENVHTTISTKLRSLKNIQKREYLSDSKRINMVAKDTLIVT